MSELIIHHTKDDLFRVENAEEDRDVNNWEDTFVCFIGFFGGYGPQVFALAPEMLEVLEAIAYYSDDPEADNDEIWKDIRKILAKAKGESQ